MEPKDLLQHPDISIQPMKDLTPSLPTLSEEAQQLLATVHSHIANDDERNEVIVAKDLYIPDNMRLVERATPRDWDRIGAVYIDGDLTIQHDLLNNDYASYPFLIITGNLTLRSWLRGGLIAFIGGDVRASGVLVGEYNDGGLFVGGDLIAKGGFLYRREPYPDFPHIKPIQIMGDVNARTFDATTPDITDETFFSTFVPEIIDDDPDCVWYDTNKALRQVAQGLSIWREPEHP
jgi:hypothetical protein